MIALSEIKPKNYKHEINPAHFNLEGYDMEIINVNENTGRGMILYIGKSLKYNIVPLHKFCQGTIIEAQVIEIALVEGSKLLFGSVYRSPNSTQENDEMLNTLIRNMSNAGYTYVVIAGDMNYPHINWESMNNRTNEEDKDFRFIEAVRDSYLTQIVDTPTRGRGSTSPSLLDIILTNDISITKYLPAVCATW